jgi:hypothetical protein
MNSGLPLTVGVCLLFAAPRVQSTMERVRLEVGVDDLNRLTQPVYDASNVAPFDVAALTASYDRKALFVRRGGGNFFTRGPEYKLDQSVDVPALFVASIRTQAAAMGLAAPTDGRPAWKVSGAVRDVYLESRQIPYGSTLFYGYLDVQLRVEDPEGTASAVTMRLHDYFSAYNAGIGRRDEAEAGAAHLLLEGAQELLARLNRSHFKAPPHSRMRAELAAIRPDTLGEQLASLRAIGLSGLQEATAPLLALLAEEEEESNRAAIIDALGSLAAPEMLGTLASRYSIEAEDCRWHTLKALDYLGGEEAMKIVRTAGLADKDVGPRRLAQRIVANNK